MPENKRNMLSEIEKYISYLESKNVAKNTISAYLSDMRDLYEYVSASQNTLDIGIDSITTDAIRNFIIEKKKNNLTNRSISRKVTAIREFFKFLTLMDMITHNPMKKIKNIKYTPALPMFFSQGEMATLCSLPDTETFVGIRDRAILEIFYSSGLRISEVVSLKISQIDFEQSLLTVIGKGNKKRKVPFTQVAHEWLSKYRKIRNNHTTDIFFLSNKNMPMTRSQIESIVKKYIKLLSLGNGYSPHTIRHSFATHLLHNGADLLAIKEMLGHENLSTTGVYTHITNEELRKEYLRGHPRVNPKKKS
jgi:site-specific recombinase XerD